MARTQSAHYGDKRSAILDKAAALFATNGFLGTSIADLASAAGVSKSLIYHYFASKDDILFAIMQRHVEALREAAALVAETRPVARLRALTHAFLGLYGDAASAHKVLINDLDKLPPDKRAEIATAERSLMQLLDDVFAGLDPDLAADAPRRRVTTMLYFGMINWTHTWYRPDGGIGSDALADMACRILLEGVGGGRSGEPGDG